MRNYWLSLALAVAAAAPVAAQPQNPANVPAAPLLDPANNRLDALLLQWEKQMSGVQAVESKITRTTVDKTFQDTDVYDGVARYMKPNLAMLEMQKKKSAAFEKYICTGAFLYEYVPQQKVIRIHEMPAPKPGQVADDNFLSFLFGMKADEAKRRYDLRLVKEDRWYVYIEIAPRHPADKADFQRARLVLNQQTFLPRELWFEQPNGNEVKWDIAKIDANANLNRLEFTRPTPPQGWSFVQVPKGTEGSARGNGLPPRVVRPNN